MCQSIITLFIRSILLRPVITQEQSNGFQFIKLSKRIFKAREGKYIKLKEIKSS